MHNGQRASGALAVVLMVAAFAATTGCARRAGNAGVAPGGGESSWVGTWAAAQQITEQRNMPPAPGLRGSTIRQVVHVSLGGRRVRVRVSNEFGDGPLSVAGVRLASSGGGGAVVPGTTRDVTFAGRAGVEIPAGEAAVSDPIAFELQPLSDVAVTMHVSDVPALVTGHPGSRTTSYLVQGDRLSVAEMPPPVRAEHWYLLSGIDVARTRGSVVVVLGNSIADGRGSGTDRQNRWPDNLARRLQANARTADVGMLNAGIGGNCVLRVCIGPAAIDRLDRDVLRQSAARWLIVSEGVNDIGGSRGTGAASVADSLIGAFERIVARAHARGVLVYGATILPFGGSQYDSPEHEAARQRVNAWIRTSRVFDAVVDFDAIMRDPLQPARLRADVDGGDHLHPNELGYRVMAGAVDLSLFAASIRAIP